MGTDSATRYLFDPVFQNGVGLRIKQVELLKALPNVPKPFPKLK